MKTMYCKDCGKQHDNYCFEYVDKLNKQIDLFKDQLHRRNALIKKLREEIEKVKYPKLQEFIERAKTH